MTRPNDALSPPPDERPEPRRRGKRPVDWTAPDDAGEDEDARDVRRRRGRDEADEAGVLSEKLIAVTDPVFGSLPLDDELAEVCRKARAMRADSGQRRTIRFIAGLLRTRERGPLLEAFRRIEAGKGAEDARFHALEAWRERLLREGDAALDALVSTYPAADRQGLRALVRQARKDRETGQGGRAGRELFRALRALDEGGESPGT
jgi:ribosome-associated protein